MSLSTDVPEPYRIRRAQEADLDYLPPVEAFAAELFRPTGLIDEDSLSITRPVSELRSAMRKELLWVASNGTGSPVGFILCDIIEDHFYITEVSVHTAHGRRGLGRALVSTACDEARRREYQAVYLSTFRDVPWNGPFYRSMGFEEISRENLQPWQRRIRSREGQTMDVWARCFMKWRV